MYTNRHCVYVFFISINFGRFYPALMLIFVSISILLDAFLADAYFWTQKGPNSILSMLIFCLILDTILACLMLISVKKTDAYKQKHVKNIPGLGMFTVLPRIIPRGLFNFLSKTCACQKLIFLM